MGVLERVHRSASIGIFGDGSAKQAWNLLGGVLPGGMGTPPSRGTQEFLRAYSEMPWLRAVAGRIATAVASADWQLFVLAAQPKPKQRTNVVPIYDWSKARSDGSVQRIQRAASRTGRKALLKQSHDLGELNEIIDHPLLNVLHQANSFQTGLAMRKLTQLHLDLAGDAFWLKERDAQGTVIAVWPVPPHWIQATPTPAFRFFRVSFRSWRGIIPDTEFTWFSDDDPLNPYARGTGIARALTDELETDEYAAKYEKAFFYNSGQPPILVWPKGGNLRPGETARLEEDWLSKTQGFWRAFKPYFLTREVEVKELDTMGSFRSQQLVQIRDQERSTIMQVFGMPPEILGVLVNSNRSTIDASSYLMSRYVVEPRLEFIRSVLQERLVPEYDERLIIDYASQVDDDPAAQTAAATTAPWALSIDEWRKRAGEAPLEDAAAGQQHMVPFNLQPTDLTAEPAPPVPLPVPIAPVLPITPAAAAHMLAIGRFSTADRTLLDDDIAVAAEAGDVALAEVVAKATSLDVDALPVPSAIAARQEPGLVRALVRVWRDHAARIDLAALERACGPSGVPGDVVALLDPDRMAQTQSAILQPQLLRGFMRGAEVGAASLRRAGVAVRGVGDAVEKPGAIAVDFAAVNPAAVAWARAHAGALVQAPADVREMVRRLTVRSIQEGIPPLELAKLLRDVVGLSNPQVTAVANFRQRLADDESITVVRREARVARYALAQERARGLTIARTELIGALNSGQQALWIEAAAQHVIERDQFEQVWLVTDDEALEETCEALADTTAEIGGTFPGGFDGPPAHVNCRCALGLQDVRGKAARRSAPRKRRRSIERDVDGFIVGVIDDEVAS